jgi:hypothetical protein
MIAGCDARKSNEDDRNEEAKSTQRQVDRAREFARSKGWAFSEEHVWVDDGISGAEWRDRRAFNTLPALGYPLAPAHLPGEPDPAGIRCSCRAGHLGAPSSINPG